MTLPPSLISTNWRRRLGRTAELRLRFRRIVRRRPPIHGRRLRRPCRRLRRFAPNLLLRLRGRSRPILRPLRAVEVRRHPRAAPRERVRLLSREMRSLACRYGPVARRRLRRLRRPKGGPWLPRQWRGSRLVTMLRRPLSRRTQACRELRLNKAPILSRGRLLKRPPSLGTWRREILRRSAGKSEAGKWFRHRWGPRPSRPWA